MNECIVFSDPISTTKVQIATRDGSQTSTWLGSMKYTNLKVFQAQNRNSTATFTILGYNSSDSINTWMVPGIEVIVVRLGHVRFSGVISRVDGDYVGYDLSQTYRVTCESDANWLLNRTNPYKKGTVYTGKTARVILVDLLYPDTMWYDNSVGIAMTNMDDTQLIDYTISDKPVLNQIQELATVAGMKYLTNMASALCSITSWGATTTLNKIRGNTWGGNTWATTSASNIGRGTHNKWVCLYMGSASTPPAVCAVTSSVAGTSVNPTSTNAINYAQFVNTREIVLIQHPLLYFKPSFGFYTTKLLYVNPASSGGVLTQSPCWNYSPLADKNDVITKVTASAIDVNGTPVSVSMAAAFKHDVGSTDFMLQSGAYKPTVEQCYESIILYSNIVPSGGFFQGNIQIFDDIGVSWGVGNWVHLTQTISPYYQESAQIAITPVHSGEIVLGRPTIWLAFTGLNYSYAAGDIATVGDSSYANLRVTDTTGFVIDAYYWFGSELVMVTAIPGGKTLSVARNMSFVSSTGAVLQTRAICHKIGCPVMNGMPNAAESTKCFDRDDYYGKGLADTDYDAPIKKYGVNTKNITVNKAVDTGTLELICYNVLRNCCEPKYKGNLNCFIDALVDPLSPYHEMKPGDQFKVDYFGTVQPTGDVYEIISLDMDFDSGTCLLQFDEYDISLMMALANMGLSINI